jgi:hypothetical protein
MLVLLCEFGVFDGMPVNVQDFVIWICDPWCCGFVDTGACRDTTFVGPTVPLSFGIPKSAASTPI